ncbi:ParD-like family protein [Legionella sp. PATHC032]|nr:ParD-like family protein [Legionella sp. PATHC032]
MTLIYCLVYLFSTKNMGIVKISDELHEATKLMAKAMSRSINSQAEYWMRIGKLAEENPSITYTDILKILVHQASPGEIYDVSEDA